MVDASTFNLQPTFPIAGVADLIANRSYKEAQMRAQQQQQLVEGLKNFGAGVDSLVQRRMQMAQALAAAHMYAGTPEGQAMLNPTTTSTTQQMPVMRGQTAQGTDDQGNVLEAPTPNTDMSGVGAVRPQTTTTTTPPAMDMGSLATAMYGESPANMMTQLYNRQKQKQEFGLEQQKQAFTEKMEPIKLQQQAELTRALTGVKGREVSVQEQNNLRNSIATEEARKQQAIKDFPELAGTFISGILPVGSNEKESAARTAFQSAQRNIDNYNRQLYSSGSGGNGPASHMSSADLMAVLNAANK